MSFSGTAEERPEWLSGVPTISVMDLGVSAPWTSSLLLALPPPRADANALEHGSGLLELLDRRVGRPLELGDDVVSDHVAQVERPSFGDIHIDEPSGLDHREVLVAQYRSGQA